MHKSEPKVNLTLITRTNKAFELKTGTTGPIRVLAPLESIFKVYSTSHYKESTELQYPM